MAKVGASSWVAIQRNRRSGAGRQFRAIHTLISELKRCGIAPRLFGQREELDRTVAMAAHPPLAIVAAGGDGTVLDVLNRHQTLPVAILPLGTENLIARYYGVPKRDGEFVARMIAADCRVPLDL
ncbi:MAG: acylglycerol kinase family protein, partial [Planctomycetaceae bacterium]|nr:acylglycerol kinase family protein [Planctomycetaceae bacterium]